MRRILKTNQRVLKAGLFAIIIITVLLVTISYVFAASEIKQNDSGGYRFYTDEANENISIPLSEPVTTENAAFFIKDTDDTFSYDMTLDLNSGDTGFTLEGPSSAYTPDIYYIILTDKGADELDDFNGLIDTDVSNDTVRLDTGSETLDLQVITVVYDPDKPIIDSVTQSYTSKTQTTLTVNAHDDLFGAQENISGLAAEAYSFDGGSSWQSSNSKSFTSSGNVDVCVQDAAGNVSAIEQVAVELDTIGPSFSVSVDPDVTQLTDPWQSSSTITITATDSLSGPHTAAYSFDDGVSWQTSNSKEFTANATVTIRVRDAVENYTSQTVELRRLDNISPTITRVDLTYNSSHNGWAKTATIEVINAQDSPSGLATEPYSFNGGSSWQSSNSITVSSKSSCDVWVKDKAGNIYNAGSITPSHIDTTPPEITIDEDSISNNWAAGSATVEFTVTDSEVGCNPSTIAGAIDNGTVLPVVLKPGEEHVYIATITGNANTVMADKIKLSANDNLGNSTVDVTSSNNILIDNTNPVISIDESTISSSWSASSTTFEFTASDTGSGIKSITGSVPSGTVTIAPKSGSTYTATVTANSDSVVDAQVEFVVTDNVNHTTTDSTDNNVKVDAKDATLTELTIQKTSGSANPNVVKNGDTVRVTFKLMDTGSGVNPASVVVQLNGVSKAAGNIDNVFTCSFTAGTDFAPGDDSLLFIKKIDYADNVGNSMTTAQNTVSSIKYYSAISAGFSDLKFWSSNADAAVAKNGDTIYVSFFTTHPVSIENGTISQSSSKNIAWHKQNDITVKSGCYYHEGSYTVMNDNAYDMQNLKFALTIGDAAENSPVSKSQADAPGIQYYAPMSISGVAIVSNNAQDTAQYAKNGDTATVTFATNHDVTVSAAAIAGKALTPAKTDGSGLIKNWTMSYTLANGDLSDLAVVPFTFTISDRAGNTPISVNNGTEGVLHTLRYYAPITATTSISSNNKNSSFAKNSDVITVTSKANHAVTITSSAICGRKANNIGSGGSILRMTYQIPSGEDNIEEATASLNYSLTDAAGNLLVVNKTNDAAESSVTYDRTNPTVSINPTSLSFSAFTVTYTITFEDEHLTGADISVKVNGKEQITSRDSSSVSGTRYTKSVTLDTDGNYKVVASLLDKAGNASDPNAETSVTVDMTKPQIKAVKLNTSTPQAFKTGFRVSDYFEFVDQNIRDIICTVSDSEGTRDWDINEPLTGDGKKTINIIVTDMADNSSTSITYDLYIDGTAPKPVIIDTQSQAAVSADQPATFISEMALSISLESLHMGDLGTADHFTKIELYKDGKVYADLLNTLDPDENGVYSYVLSAFGDYTLVLSAVDDVGNATGDLEYHFFFNDKNIFQKFYENTPLFVTVISVLVIGIAAMITLKIVRKNKQNTTANSI